MEHAVCSWKISTTGKKKDTKTQNYVTAHSYVKVYALSCTIYALLTSVRILFKCELTVLLGYFSFVIVLK